MIHVPVICDNPSCGTVWFTPSPFGGAGTMYISGSKVHPCPQCHGAGSIPDGIYTQVEGRLADPEQLRKVVDAFKHLQEMFARGATPDEIGKAIQSDKTLREYLGQYVPQNWADLQNMITVLSIVGAMAIYNMSSMPGKVALAAPSIIVEAFEEFFCQRQPQPDEPDDDCFDSNGGESAGD